MMVSSHAIAASIDRLVRGIDRRWDRLVGQRRPADDTRFAFSRHLVAALAIAGYAGLDAARRGLDQAVQKVHLVGDPGYGVNDLHHGSSTANRALAAWRDGSVAFDAFLRVGGRTIALWQTAVELLLVPFSTLLLLGLVRFLRNQIADAPPGAIERPGPYRSVLAASTLAVAGYFLLGVFDQILELVILVRDHADPVTAVPLMIGSWGRRACLLAVLVPMAVTTTVLSARLWRPLQRIREAGSAYRVLIVIAVVHVAVLQLSVPAEQSRDAIRLWPEQGWLAVWGLLATCGFSFALAVLAMRLSTLRRSGGEVLGMGATGALALGGGALAFVGWMLHAGASWGNGVTALGILLAVVALLSLPILWLSDQTPQARPLDQPGHQAQVLVPALVTMAPLVALERAVVAAAMPDLIAGTRARWLVLVGAVVLVLAVSAYLLARLYGEWAMRAAADQRSETARRRLFEGTVAGLWVAAIGVAAWVCLDPWGHARALGVHGLLGVFLVVLTLTIGTLGYLLEGRAIPASLDFVGLRRIPVVSALVAWGLLGNVLPDAEFHAIRVVEGGQATATRVLTADRALARWIAANVPEAAPAAATEEPRVVPGVPLVFVTAAGGGIRAATFSAAVLECLFGDDDPGACQLDDGFATADGWPRVFAASGASGGSVGIASFTAQRRLGGPDADWVVERLGTDLLSPELAWQLFVEAPNSLLSFNPDRDRAEILERTWERRFGSDRDGPGAAPFLAGIGDEGWPQPLLFLNGTNLPDGCRVVISSARSSAGGAGTEPAPDGASARDDCRRRRLDDPTSTLDQSVAREIVDYLCPGEDLRLSTAAFLSARFPLVSPTGIVPDRAERRDGCGSATAPLSVGDAGYRDNTGASSIQDLWNQLRPHVTEFNRTHDRCIVPFLVEIDNGHRNRGATAAPSPSIQLAAPLQGALGVFSSRDAGPIEALTADFSRALDPSVDVTIGGLADPARVARLSLYEHPGVLAPLGWSLSDAAVNDLANQLDRVTENQVAVATVGSWLRPGAITCTVDP